MLTSDSRSYWDEEQPSTSRRELEPQLPFVQRGISGVVLAGIGIPSAGSLLGLIRVESDAVRVRGFLGRWYEFPRAASTHIGRAQGLFIRGVRLRSDNRANDVVFFPWDATAAAALVAALEAAGFHRE